MVLHKEVFTVEHIQNVLIKKIILSKNMFTVAIGEFSEGNQTIESTFIGNFYCVQGEKFNFEGSWTMHPTYGKQFKVEGYQKIQDLLPEDIEQYLTGFKGIGISRAKKIVSAFGDKTLEVIKDNYEKLTEIGIPKDIALNIHANVVQNTIVNDLIRMLKPKGLSFKTINKIYEQYREHSINIVKNNPYRLADDISGINFSMADYIAKDIGVDYDCGFRIQGAIKQALMSGAEQGHSFLFIEELIKMVHGILSSKNQKDIDTNIIIKVLANMEEYKQLIIESDTAVYLPMYYYAERYSARKISKIRESKSNLVLNYDPADIIKMVEEEVGFQYADQQREAIQKGLTEKIMILTGGPGTGKTTTVNGIIKAILKNDPRTKLELAAPTGKAAKRMEEATGKSAKTIHRLLEYKPFGDELQCGRNEENPIDADVLIVDEFSMTDILLLEKLLRALHIGTRLIIVGDVDQLPSVGAGNVLADMINSGVICTIRLNTIFRQKGTSMIVVNAYKINNGEYPDFSQSDFTFTKIDDKDEVVAKEVVNKYVELIQSGKTTSDVQVLTPLKRKTACGSKALNELIQEAINPARTGVNEVKFGFITFREGDKVMQTKNNYEKECFNGDTGYISRIDKSKEDATIIVKFDDKEVEFTGREEILELELAYAISIHKSQGSEYDTVLIPMVMSHKRLLAKNLFYTGVTRAKSVVHIFGSQKAIEYAVNNKNVAVRNSKLHQKLI